MEVKRVEFMKQNTSVLFSHIIMFILFFISLGSSNHNVYVFFVAGYLFILWLFLLFNNKNKYISFKIICLLIGLLIIDGILLSGNTNSGFMGLGGTNVTAFWYVLFHVICIIVLILTNIVKAISFNIRRKK